MRLQESKASGRTEIDLDVEVRERSPEIGRKVMAEFRDRALSPIAALGRRRLDAKDELLDLRAGHSEYPRAELDPFLVEVQNDARK
jgi:hypothetical protein